MFASSDMAMTRDRYREHTQTALPPSSAVSSRQGGCFRDVLRHPGSRRSVNEQLVAGRWLSRLEYTQAVSKPSPAFPLGFDTDAESRVLLNRRRAALQVAWETTSSACSRRARTHNFASRGRAIRMDLNQSD